MHYTETLIASKPRKALLETRLPMTEETTENFLRRGMGRSELQPGKRRSEGNSLEEGEEAAAGGSSSAAALGGWVDRIGTPPPVGVQVKCLTHRGGAARQLRFIACGGRRKGSGRCMHLGSGWQQPLRSPRLSRSVSMTCGPWWRGFFSRFLDARHCGSVWLVTRRVGSTVSRSAVGLRRMSGLDLESVRLRAWDLTAFPVKFWVLPK
jgi:hypothetical protein